jgi:hypothetical protein
MRRVLMTVTATVLLSACTPPPPTLTVEVSEEASKPPRTAPTTAVATSWPPAPIPFAAEFLATYDHPRLFVGWETDVAYLDIESNVWSTLPALPGGPLRERAVVVDGTDAYAMGGVPPECRSCPHLASGYYINLNAEAMSWQSTPDLPWGSSDELLLGRHGSTTIAVAEQDGALMSAALEAASERWETLPVPVSGKASLLRLIAVKDATVALVRGSDGFGAMVLRDIAAGWSGAAWTRVKGEHATAGALGNRLALVTDGDGASAVFFDPNTMHWVQQRELPFRPMAPDFGEAFGWHGNLLVPAVGYVQIMDLDRGLIEQRPAPQILLGSDILWTGEELLSWGGFGPNGRSLQVYSWGPYDSG